ncbi:hypothetical protein EFB08_07625 [Rufibacter latericius]|uniref:Uncharacterized protein n=2 Tax=Rufibacter latericius TaxID=2487040 RepID=A0A3M9MUT5_9BACT|nr:hypothetical protein EFB08_07625 [Rufibacter latericius]
MLGMAPSQDAAQKMEEMGCCTAKKKPACPEGTTQVDKTPCCSVSTTHHKLDVPSTLKFSKVEFVALLPALTSVFLLPPVATATVEGSWPYYSDTSPPRAGRDLLHHLHILNI